MKKLLFVLLVGMISNVEAQQEVEVLKFEDLKEKIKKDENKTLLINFWATWCVPCIEEMPLLMEMNEQFRNHPEFKMLLVSLDSKKSLGKLQGFLAKHKIDAEVVLLDDNKRMNEWIPAMDSQWQGNLPSTFVYHRGRKVAFIDGEVTRSQLQALADRYLKPSK
ncbi:MAG: TlpA family protein disulfide reductase [Chitinophagaceae bacterium]|nr:TlpA family protein disulfide reductase [Chitinophagaceae bacterium]MCW5926560.1 TlpA family protein disulfide reductase [Chitinophagaceae bacterium]